MATTYTEWNLTVTLKVAQSWVEDGFDAEKSLDGLREKIREILPYAESHEVFVDVSVNPQTSPPAYPMKRQFKNPNTGNWILILPNGRMHAKRGGKPWKDVPKTSLGVAPFVIANPNVPKATLLKSERAVIKFKNLKLSGSTAV